MSFHVGGIILCGGESRRMGQPKAWLPFAGERMLPRVVRILNEVVSPIAVVAAPGQDLPPLPASVPIVRDAMAGRGPLQGISDGLRALTGAVDSAYVSSCDVPLLQPAFVRRMIDLLGDNQMCVPCCNAIHHPLAAVYRVDVAPVIDRLLAQNRLRLQCVMDELRTRIVTEVELRDVDPGLKSLQNLNTPQEYEAARREVERR